MIDESGADYESPHQYFSIEPQFTIIHKDGMSPGFNDNISVNLSELLYAFVRAMNLQTDQKFLRG